MSIGSLTIDILAKTGSFETDTKRAAKIAQQRAKEIDDAFAKAGKAIGVALAAGATAAAYAFKSTVDRMDELSKAAARAAMPTEEFSRLAYAADLADVSMQDLQGSMGRLAKAQGDAARGVTEQSRAFDALGISYRNADGSLRKTSDVFADFADRFQEFQGSPEIVAVGMQIFGRSFQNLIPLLKDGAQGLRDAGDEADAFGVTLSTKAGQQAEAFNDNITRLTKAAEGLKLELFSGLVPQLNDVIGRFIMARKEGIAFIDAIDVAANMQGFRPLADQIDTARNKIASLQKMLRDGVGPGGGHIDRGAMAEQIRLAEEQLERLLRVQRRMSGADPLTGSFGNLVGEPPVTKPRTLRLPSGKGKPAADALASVLDSANQRDFDRVQQFIDDQEELAVLIARALHDQDMAMGAQADAWRDLIDPTRAYTRQLEEIRALVASGHLSPAAGIAAEFEVESRRNDELLGAIAESTNAATDAAHELGLTFSSAFEDAIVGGKKFSDVLKGLGQDITRIFIRKAITEPLANSIAGSLNLGSLFGGKRALGGPVDVGMTYLVGERGPELFTPKTSGNVVPNHQLGGGVTINQTLHIGAGVSRSEVAAALAISNAELKRQLYEDRRNGGVFA